EVAAMIQAVTVLRTASRISREPRRRYNWQRWAAAAVFLLAALSSGSSPALRESLAPAASLEVRAATVRPARVQLMPTLERLDQPRAPGYPGGAGDIVPV